MRIGSISLFVFWLAFSCQEIKDCSLESSTDYAWLRFYRADTAVKTSKEVAFRRIYEVDASFFVISTMEDTIDDDTLRQVVLPLNPEVKKVQYIFETDSVNYSLTVEYTPHLRIYYEDCDPVYSFKLDTAYGAEFDSVRITTPVLDKEVGDNLEIYL